LDNCSRSFLAQIGKYLPKLLLLKSDVDTKCRTLTNEWLPTKEERDLLSAAPNATSLQRIKAKGQIICTQDYNKNSTTISHLFRPQKGKCYIVKQIIEERAGTTGSSTKVHLLCQELINCVKLMLIRPFDSDKNPPTFLYISTFKCILSNLTKLDPTDVCELATYVIDMNNKNFVFDIFNRHM